MNNEFMAKVFRWLGVGLFVTFLTGYLVSINASMLKFLYAGYGYIVVCVLEIVVCIYFSSRISKMNPNTARVLYIGYTGLTGVALSFVFLAYKLESIIFIFLITSLVFIIFSIIGRRVDFDLKKIGVYLAILLVSIIVLEIFNVFVMNNTLNMILCIASLAIFVGYVAYDVKKIDYYEENENMAIMAAFELFLDFINIFIRLLELFGDRKD